MALRPEDLPKDPALLVEMILALDGEKEDLRAEIITLKTLIFGARSEQAAKILAEQLALDLSDAEAAPPLAANDETSEKPDSGKKKRKARRNIGALPKHLPRCERILEPETTLCPCCSGQMHRIGEEVSEALDRAPAQIRVLRTVRPKYACRACEGPIVRRRRPRGSSKAAWRRQHSSPTSPSPNTPGCRRSTVRRRFWPATASPSTARRWRAG